MTDEETRKFDPKDAFWTDAQQASERLLNSVILYDGNPVLVTGVRGADHFDDGIPRVSIKKIGAGTPDVSSERKRIDSPKFNKYRALPTLGFMNVSRTRKAIFLERRTVRGRQHGLTNSNVKGVSLWAQEKLIENSRNEYLTTPLSGFHFESYYFSEDLKKMFNNEYPPLSDILANIRTREFIAYSRMFAVYKDTLGICWLYRADERIGLFTNNNTLSLVRKFRPYREEITEDVFFTLDNIAEI